MSDLLEKLISVERTVNVYSVETKELLNEITIDVPIDELRKIVPPKDGDPMLYLGYKLNIKQVFELNNYLTHKISPDFGSFSYYLVCEGIYQA